MKKRDLKFLSEVKSFDQTLMKEIQSFLLPAFKGMRFGSPSCDSDDDGVYISGSIFETDSVWYNYNINFYPKDDLVRVNITRNHDGRNVTRLTMKSDKFWIIEGSNLTAKDIAEQKRLLDAELPDKLLRLLDEELPNK